MKGLSISNKVKPSLDNSWMELSYKLKEELNKSKVEATQESQVRNVNLPLDPKDANSSVEFLLSLISNKFRLTPSQAIGLMSNDKRPLIQTIIRGHKGDFKPVVEFYKELFMLIPTVVNIVKNEKDGAVGIVQLLDIIKGGFYSRSTEVMLLTFRVLAKFANEINNKESGGVAWEWFITENGGLSGLLHCFKKNSHIIAENAIYMMCQFGRYNFVELFLHYMKLCFKSLGEYMQMVTVLLQPLAEYKVSRDQIKAGGVLEVWAELGTRKADSENEDIQERASALSMLVEMWTCFPEIIEERLKQGEQIVRLLQRANRDKVINLQIISLSLQFKLLDMFAILKDPYASIVYKSLTFALIENHQRQDIREFILGNFRHIFLNLKTIPASILLDPFIRSIRNCEGITFTFNLFDFEFFTVISKHQKLTSQNAVQTLDLLAKVYLCDQTYAECAVKPFMNILERYKDDKLVSEFTGKLMKFELGQYCKNIRNAKASSELKEARYFGHEEIDKEEQYWAFVQNRKIIDLMYKVMQLGQDDINTVLKQNLFSANSFLKRNTNEDNPRLVSMLQHVDTMLLGTSPDMDLSINRSINRSPLEDYYGQSLGLQIPKIKTKGYIEPSEDSIERHRNNRSVLEKQILSDEIRQRRRDLSEEPRYAEKPSYVFSGTEEGEKISKSEKRGVKKNREKKIKKILKEQLKARKAELDDASMSLMQMEQNVILEEALLGKSQKEKETEICLLNYDEEEDKEIEGINICINKYAEFLQTLFDRYSSKSKKHKSISYISTLKVADVSKMMKDFNVVAQLLSMPEFLTIFKLVNAKYINTGTSRKDFIELSLDGFKELFTQLSIFIHRQTTSPLFNQPFSSKLEALISHFKMFAKLRGDSELLPYIPIGSELAMQKGLEKHLKINPYYPMPEGFKKEEHKVIIDNYIVSPYISLYESQVIAIELLDSLLAENFGIHFLEPITSYSTEAKVFVEKTKKKPSDDLRHFMLPLKKKSRKSTLSPLMSSNTYNAKKLKELKKTIAPESRPRMEKMQDEYVNAIEYMTNIIDTIGNVNDSHEFRESTTPLNPYSIAPKLGGIVGKIERSRAVLPMISVLSAKSKKSIIEDNRKMREQRAREEMARKQREAEEYELQMIEERRQLEERKKQLVEQRKKREISQGKIQVIENRIADAERKLKVEELRTLKKHKDEQFKQDLKAIIEGREQTIKLKEDKRGQEEEKLQKHREIVNERITKDREKREKMKQQKKLMDEFMKSENAQRVLAEYRKQLKQIFSFIARLDEFDPNKAFSQNISSIDENKFLQFCSYFRIVPTLMLSEDASSTFKETMKAKSLIGEKIYPQSTQAKGAQAQSDLFDCSYEDFEEIIVKFSLMSKNCIDANGRLIPNKPITKEFEICSPDSNSIQSMLKYLRLNKDDDKMTLNQRLKLLKLEADKGRKKKPYEDDVIDTTGSPEIMTKSPIPVPILEPKEGEGRAGGDKVIHNIVQNGPQSSQQ